MNRESVIWAAGFLEGEGSFTCYGSTRLPYVQAHSTDKDVLDRLASIFGGNVWGPYTSNGGNLKTTGWTKPVYSWGTRGARGYAIMVAVYPWLGERRRVDVELCILSWLRYKRKKQDYSLRLRDARGRLIAKEARHG